MARTGYPAAAGMRSTYTDNVQPPGAVTQSLPARLSHPLWSLRRQHVLSDGAPVQDYSRLLGRIRGPEVNIKAFPCRTPARKLKEPLWDTLIPSGSAAKKVARVW